MPVHDGIQLSPDSRLTFYWTEATDVPYAMLQVKNNSIFAVVANVKTTNPARYQVTPPNSVLQRGQTVNIKFQFAERDAVFCWAQRKLDIKADRFMIQTAKVMAADTGKLPKVNNDAKAANTIATWWTAKAEEDKDRPKGERAIMAQKLESTFVFGGQMGSTKGSSTATSSGNSTGAETEAASGDSSFFSASSSLSPLRMLRRINMTASAKKEAKQDVKSSLNEFSNPLSRLASLQQLPGNEVCADCLGESPTWASVNRGVFLCTQCSGVHRSLGVHISMILSCRLDNFTESQLDVLEHNGNLSTNERLEYHVPSSWPKPHPEEGRRYRELYIRAKYEASYFARREPQPAVQREAPFKESDSLPSALSDLQTSSPAGSSTSDALSSSPVGMVEYIG